MINRFGSVVNNKSHLKHNCLEKNRVVVVGSGAVGATTAFALMVQGIASEIVLIDANKERAEGEAFDLAHGIAFAPEVKIWAGDYSDCREAKVVVIAAGMSQIPGQSRLDLVHINSLVTIDVINNIKKHTNNAVILMVTNPLDVLTYVAFRQSGLPSHQILGSGTTLDSSRFRHALAEEFGFASDSVSAYLIGEHGDSQVPIYSHCNVLGESMMKLPHYSKDKLERAYLSTKHSAAGIVSKKGHTCYAIALAAARIVRAIIYDENSIFPVSVFLQGQYGLRDIYLSVPSVIGRGGIKRVLEIDLSESEMNNLHKSAEIIKNTIRSVK